MTVVDLPAFAYCNGAAIPNWPMSSCPATTAGPVLLPRPVLTTTFTPCFLKKPPSTPMTICEPIAACATGSATLKVGTDPPELDERPPPGLFEALAACVVLLELEPQPTHASVNSRTAASAALAPNFRDIV